MRHALSAGLRTAKRSIREELREKEAMSVVCIIQISRRKEPSIDAADQQKGRCLSLALSKDGVKDREEVDGRQGEVGLRRRFCLSD